MVARRFDVLLAERRVAALPAKFTRDGRVTVGLRGLLREEDAVAPGCVGRLLRLQNPGCDVVDFGGLVEVEVLTHGDGVDDVLRRCALLCLLADQANQVVADGSLDRRVGRETTHPY